MAQHRCHATEARTKLGDLSHKPRRFQTLAMAKVRNEVNLWVKHVIMFCGHTISGGLLYIFIPNTWQILFKYILSSLFLALETGCIRTVRFTFALLIHPPLRSFSLRSRGIRGHLEQQLPSVVAARVFAAWS